MAPGALRMVNVGTSLYQFNNDVPTWSGWVHHGTLVIVLSAVRKSVNECSYVMAMMAGQTGWIAAGALR